MDGAEGVRVVRGDDHDRVARAVPLLERLGMIQSELMGDVHGLRRLEAGREVGSNDDVELAQALGRLRRRAVRGFGRRPVQLVAHGR